MVDTRDLKSLASNGVRVRYPLSAPLRRNWYHSTTPQAHCLGFRYFQHNSSFSPPDQSVGDPVYKLLSHLIGGISVFHKIPPSSWGASASFAGTVARVPLRACLEKGDSSARPNPTRPVCREPHNGIKPLHPRLIAWVWDTFVQFSL